MTNIGKREQLILRRRQSLKNQSVVACDLGISQARYSLIENGLASPSKANAQKLIEMFDLPSEYFTTFHTSK